MMKISETLISGKECDTLLSTCEYNSKKKDTLINSQDKAIKLKDRQLHFQEIAILKQDTVINIQQGWLRKAKRQLKWTKVGWAGTSLGLVLLIIITNLRF